MSRTFDQLSRVYMYKSNTHYLLFSN